ncbi:MAG: fasciclin domain-containing protein [Bacteroidales bacterium]|jgi:uncharacterized surface protein with fasciclin (FAS1) repeats|nr:fasciclin domain-containing protein [Bacteroidales bacterium]
MKKNIFKSEYIATVLSVGLILAFSSCEKNIDESVTFGEQDVSIATYINQHGEEIGDFMVLARQAGYSGILGVYGSYTAFIFTNQALADYKQAKGISQFTDEQATRLIQYHLLKAVITTETMGNGGLKQVTFDDDYLTASFQNANDLVINYSAKITTRDLVLTNGVIHIIDKVLEPIDYSVRDLVFNTADFSIFKAAWQETGFDDVYNSQINPTTFFVVSDAVYQNYGITSLSQLKNQPFINNDADALKNYVAYHAISGFKFLNMIENGNFPTLGSELMSFKSENVYKINKEIVGNTETYISVNTDESNRQAKNGVVHRVGELVIPKNPLAEYYFFDFWFQPEVMAMPGYLTIPKNSWIGGMENLTYERMKVQITGGELQYFISSYYPDNQNFINIDHYNITAGSWTIEFTLPKIAAGKYRLRMRFKDGPTRAICQTYWNGDKLGDPVNMRTNYVPNEKDQVVAVNYKRIFIADLDLKETKEHVIQFKTVVAGQGNLDGIEFIPIN